MRHGFTLAELIAVVCIIAIVTSTAMPAIDNFMSSQKVGSVGEEFVSNVRMARYKAMQESALHRLVFDEDSAGNVSGYKIQIYGNYDTDSENNVWNDSDDEETEEDTNSVATSIVNFKIIELNDSKWHSVLDFDEVVFDSNVEVTHSPKPNTKFKVIYFSPSGYLICVKDDKAQSACAYSDYTTTATDNITESNYALLNENALNIVYGNAKAVIRFNAIGILSSETISDSSDDE